MRINKFSNVIHYNLIFNIISGSITSSRKHVIILHFLLI